MEQEQPVSQEQQVSDSEPTLEQVYSEFKVDDVAQSFTPQPQQVRQPEPTLNQFSQLPDPVLDSAAFKEVLSRQTQSVQEQLSNLQATQQAMVMGALRRQEEADIQSAVSLVKGKIGGDVDDDMVEIALAQKARKDSKFNTIWQNRHKNPQALKAALSAVGNELKGKFSFRQDPQLTENARAAKQSTQSSLTQSGDSPSNPIEKALSEAKDPRAFEAAWSRMVSGGY